MIAAESQSISNFSHYKLDIKSVPKLEGSDDISGTEIASYVELFLQLNLTFQDLQD